MSDKTEPTVTLDEALREPPVCISGGLSFRARKLRAKDSGEILGVYGLMLTIIADRVGHDPSDAEVMSAAPWVLFRAFGAEESFTKFVLSLCDASEEQVGDLDLDGFAALWAAIYEANKCPFDLLHADAKLLIERTLEPEATEDPTPEPTPTTTTDSSEPASTSATTP